MSPRSRFHVVALVISLLLVAPTVARAQDVDEPTTITSPDGTAALVIPSGVDADGVSVTLRPPEEFPPEVGIGQAPHLDIEPHNAVFDPPARLTRRVSAADLGIDPVSGPFVIGVFLHGTADGPWVFTQEATFSTDTEAGELVISGNIAGGGLILTVADGSVYWEDRALSEIPVGESAIVETTFILGEDVAATVEPASTTTGDETVAIGSNGFVTPMFGDTLVGHHVDCRAPGTVKVAIADTIGEYVGGHPAVVTFGLAGTTVTVVHETEVTCVG